METMAFNQKPIVVVGSINMDMVATTNRIPTTGETVLGTGFQTHPGGKGANQAVAVARLGYPVKMVGRLGSDSVGAELRAHLQEAGVDTAGVANSEGASGVAIIVVSEDGQNIIVVTPGANAKLTPEDLDANIETIRNAGIVLAQLEIPMETVEYLAKICAREGVPLMLDPAPAAELSPELLKQIQWITPNQTEAGFYLKDRVSTEGKADEAAIAQSLLNKGPRGVILKMGGDGVYVADQAGLRETVSAFNMKVIDTTAAGDAFNGGFATALMLGKSPAESARFANAVAGISVTRQGAQPSMPSMSEVEELLAKESQTES
jgi:ribokinase